MPSEITHINRQLLEKYGRGILVRDAIHGVTGKDLSSDLPTFRIVWTTDQIEVRYLEHNVFSESGDIFLRTERGVERVKKYEWDDKWVLEQLVPSDGNPYLQRAGVQYSYEPLWVFGNAKSDPMPVWRYVELLVHQTLVAGKVVKSPRDLKREDDELLAKEKIRCKEFLQDETPAIPFQLHHGLAVTVGDVKGKISLTDGDSNG